jgi:ring-1,2-phenylacetyl-CoA epoxidase subunit PaaB
MQDTQGPVYQVFERPALGRPMQAGGSVHAVGPEMALENAWDVYGRRPTSVALWVVPRNAICAKTREELAALQPGDEVSGREEEYCVFAKSASRLIYEEEGRVLAASAQEALTRGVEQTGSEASAWWVFPASAITSSESFPGGPPFGPQRNKWFRDQRSFPVTALLRELSQAARKRQP